MKLLKDAAVQGDVSNLSIFGAYGSCQKTNTKKVPIYWEYTKFGQGCDIQRIGTKFRAISELEFALNSTLLKVHVSKWYRKCYWSLLMHTAIGKNNSAFMASEFVD